MLIEAIEGKASSFASTTLGSTVVSDASIDVQLMPQLIELRELDRKYGSNHPEVITLRNKIDTARDILKGTTTGTRGRLAYPSASSSDSNVLTTATATLGLLATPHEQGPLLTATTVLASRSVKWEILHYVQLLRAQLRDVRLTEQALKDLAGEGSNRSPRDGELPD